MARNRILKDTVSIFNYIGEIQDEATYQETVLKNCYCTINEGVNHSIPGRSANNSGRLYIFVMKTTAEAADGTKRTFLPYDEWKALEDKSAFWTISNEGTDFFKKSGSDLKLKITGFSFKKAGTSRMWHYEVDGK